MKKTDEPAVIKEIVTVQEKGGKFVAKNQKGENVTDKFDRGKLKYTHDKKLILVGPDPKNRFGYRGVKPNRLNKSRLANPDLAKAVNRVKRILSK